jgi:ankyrin repeat protein
MWIFLSIVLAGPLYSICIKFFKYFNKNTKKKKKKRFKNPIISYLYKYKSDKFLIQELNKLEYKQTLINQCNIKGQTPLYIAIKLNKSKEIINTLLNLGADIFHITFNEESVLDLVL